MKLSDVMSAMALSSYAEVALVIFFLAFLAVVVQVISKNGADFEHARHLTLDEEPARSEPPAQRRQ